MSESDESPLALERETTEVDLKACGRPTGQYKGTFPLGFLNYLDKHWGVRNRKVLFPFGGITPDREQWTVNDLNTDLDVDTHHDATDLPDEWSESFDVVVADPPYGERYAEELYDLDYAGPKAHFVESERVLREGGHLLILDFLVYTNYCPDSLKRLEPRAISCGPNLRMRTLNIFRKRNTL